MWCKVIKAFFNHTNILLRYLGLDRLILLLVELDDYSHLKIHLLCFLVQRKYLYLLQMIGCKQVDNIKNASNLLTPMFKTFIISYLLRSTIMSRENKKFPRMHARVNFNNLVFDQHKSN